jgi:drug/metabolite transporter (DMT)-like permease
VGLTRRGEAIRHPGSWISAALLFLYAAAFSFAYVSLSTGVGALILFGAVQATMIIAGITMGERPHFMVWCGIAIALAGLVYLVLPGFSAPPLTGAALMAAAGISWGIYSIRGRDVQHPVAITGHNFLRTLPFALALTLMLIRHLDISLHGALLAAVSGAITSGMGYVIWYAAIRNLSATQAASVQLLVPAIAALGGVLLLSEQITLRLVLASVMLFAGVGTTIAFRHR